MRPIGGSGDISVFNGIVMDVIDVAAKIVIVAESMFPKPALPYAAFTLAAAAGVDGFAFGYSPGKSGLD